MATNILIINPQFIKDNSPLAENIDSVLLTPFIKQCQMKYIERALGTDLLSKITNDISGGTLTGVYKTLVDEMVQPALNHWVIYESMPFLNYKITNKSVVSKNSDQSTAVGLDEVKYIRDGVRDTAEYFTSRMIKYVQARQSSYPEFYTNSDLDDIRPNKNPYFSGIYLGNGYNDSCNFGVDLPRYE